MIRVPDKGITFIVLANNETLSSAYPMGEGARHRTVLREPEKIFGGEPTPEHNRYTEMVKQLSEEQIMR